MTVYTTLIEEGVGCPASGFRRLLTCLKDKEKDFAVFGACCCQPSKPCGGIKSSQVLHRRKATARSATNKTSTPMQRKNSPGGGIEDPKTRLRTFVHHAAVDRHFQHPNRHLGPDYRILLYLPRQCFSGGRSGTQNGLLYPLLET